VKTHTHHPAMSVAEYRRLRDPRTGMVPETPESSLDAFLSDATVASPSPRGNGDAASTDDALDRMLAKADLPAASSTDPQVWSSTPTPSGKGRGRWAREHQQKRASGGNRAEERITPLFTKCAEAGVGWVIKIPTPVRPKRSKAGLQLRYLAKAGVDYMGHMIDRLGARPVYAEAKKTLKGRLSLTEVKPHQRAILDNALSTGCVAILMVVAGATMDVYAVPWAIARTHRVLGPEELDGWLVSPVDPAFLSRWAR
jgi:hypothetical protein